MVFYVNAETLCAQLRYVYASLNEAAVILIPLWRHMCERKSGILFTLHCSHVAIYKLNCGIWNNQLTFLHLRDDYDVR